MLRSPPSSRRAGRNRTSGRPDQPAGFVTTASSLPVETARPRGARASDITAFFNLEASGKPGQLVEYDSTEKIFSNPAEKTTEDYVSGRFG